ncbi:WbqC family protein [Nonlabens ponticola]|uniref:WbqC family protein n=1 Tax=Nonlabens ponticola TaxID=2496866 RepID=A0A3S9MYE1_9FLAO|nr:WbqC family protein [Nonlabens ponticola]AZQ44266.1 hypothetical protein EJ995_08455 [Nonlabens ponticola]
MNTIVHPGYFMDVLTWSKLIRSDTITLDLGDSYVKQTYRNRCYIAAANGQLALNIPIVHQGKKESVSYADIDIDQSQPWKSQHLKSIASAYKSSPYFEYYQDDLIKLYDQEINSLQQWNLACVHWVAKQLHMDQPIVQNPIYQFDSQATYLITAKKQYLEKLPPYIQVFQEKHGFVQHLSILDLLFNLGAASRVYLLKLSLKATGHA